MEGDVCGGRRPSPYQALGWMTALTANARRLRQTLPVVPPVRTRQLRSTDVSVDLCRKSETTFCVFSPLKFHPDN